MGDTNSNNQNSNNQNNANNNNRNQQNGRGQSQESGRRQSQENGRRQSQENGRRQSQENGRGQSQESGRRQSQENGRRQSQENGRRQSQENGRRQNQENGRQSRQNSDPNQVNQENADQNQQNTDPNQVNQRSALRMRSNVEFYQESARNSLDNDNQSRRTSLQGQMNRRLNPSEVRGILSPAPSRVQSRSPDQGRTVYISEPPSPSGSDHNIRNANDDDDDDDSEDEDEDDEENKSLEDVRLTSEVKWAFRNPSQQFNVIRRVYLQEALKRDADYHAKSEKPLWKQFWNFLQRCGFDSCLSNALPILDWLPKYNMKKDLLGDVVAGSTVAILNIPQGMAYAMLAEVPAITGLYMAFFPILIYVFLGSSPHVSMGSECVACLMVGKVIQNLATFKETFANGTTVIHSSPNIPGLEGQQFTPTAVASMCCLTVGLFQFIMWTLRLGAMSNLLSEPLISGFTTGASLVVIITQLKDIFGIKVPKFNENFQVPLIIESVILALPTLNIAATLISVIAITVIMLNNELLKPWVSKRSRIPVPIELMIVILGTASSKLLNAGETLNLSLVGTIPTGLPSPEVPPVQLFSFMALDSFIITIVTYTIVMSLALSFAVKAKYEVDANQELLAMGASNSFASFFGCMPFCASLSRSNIVYTAGGKTCISSVVCAALLLFVLLWIGPFFEALPRCVLAALIIGSLKGMMMQVSDLKKFFQLSTLDALVWLVTFLVTVIVNIDIGLLSGIAASVGALFYRSQTPYTCLLGRVAHTDLYLDCKRYRAAKEINGIKIFHYCGALNFATKNLFRELFHRKIGYMKPRRRQRAAAGGPDSEHRGGYEWDPTIEHRVKCVIIDATALSFLDATGIRAIVSVQGELRESNISMILAGPNGPVLEMIDRYNAKEMEQLQLDVFPTVHDAVVFFKALSMRQKSTTFVD